MDHTQIIILAGGKGTRMESDNPKAVTLFKGEPFLSHVLSTVEKITVKNKPIVVVGYKANIVKEVIGERCIYVVQEEQLGTGHAVLCTKNSVPEHIRTVFVSYTDHPLLQRETIENIIQKRIDTNATLVMGTTIVNKNSPWKESFEKFGRIKRDTDGSLLGIVEYKDATEEEKNINEVNPAYFAFEASWMWEHLAMLDNNNTQAEYYLTDLVAMAFAEKKHIETVAVLEKEALGANSKKELELLESL